MSLRETAIADLRAITENCADFGWPIKVTNPAGEFVEIHGLSTDIGLTIDPETGVAVVGRKASVAIARGTLEDIGMPIGVASSSQKPWLVSFMDDQCVEHNYKVSETMPDRTLGVVVCILEAYKP